MKETLKTISERTGISTSTISRVLSGKAEKYRISRKTAAIVTAEARKCKYTPSSMAHSLRNNKSNTIGLILPLVSNPGFFAEITKSIISAAQQKGYITIVADNMDNTDNQKNCLSALISRKVDGIIAAACGDDPRLFEEVNQNIVPVVLIDRYFEKSKVPYVTTNNFKGAFMATEHLIRNGHKHIACIQGNRDSSPSRRRVDGYLQAMKEYNLSENAIVAGDSFSIQNGYLETKLLLSREPRPTAIFPLSYTILLGVIKALRDSSIRIPEDISVLSFDDSMSLDYMTPPFSRVCQPVEEMGRLAAKLLFERIESKSYTATQLELTPNMVLLDSVKSI